jgi:UDP-arabinose 4-epimerase
MPASSRPPPRFRSALVTGCGGFVGGSLVRHLRTQGVSVAGLDSFARGHADQVPDGVPCIAGDVRDPDAVREALKSLGKPPEVCFHLAGLILVGESVEQPALYHDVNAAGTQVVADACLDAGVRCMLVASSAAVLAPVTADQQRLGEDARLQPESPYGESKLRAEQTVRAATVPGRMSGAALRLFNVAGADGVAERHDPESHLIPLAIRATTGELPPLRLFGTDLPTPDGTCVRDYVHVRDVIDAFVQTAGLGLQAVDAGEANWQVFHVGSGRGRSVREVVAAVARCLGQPVPLVEAGRRAGDVPALVADPTLLRARLGIEPSADLDAMVRDCAAALGVLA